MPLPMFQSNQAFPFLNQSTCTTAAERLTLPLSDFPVARRCFAAVILSVSLVSRNGMAKVLGYLAAAVDIKDRAGGNIQILPMTESLSICEPW